MMSNRRLLRLIKTCVEFSFSDESVLDILQSVEREFKASRRGQKAIARYLGELKREIPDIEIYLDRVTRKAHELIILAIVHELAHDAGLKEKQARKATESFLRMMAAAEMIK